MATLSTPLETSLSTVQIDAVAFLAAGNSILAAAQSAGVHRATIHNWLKLPDFCAALAEARSDYADHMRTKLKEIAALALDTIRQTLTDSQVSPAVKLKAALAVLDRSLFPKPGAPLPVEGIALPEEAESARPTTAPANHTEIARNAPCPCGSGNKYKRCCGTNAPPQLGRAA
jgi:hypothetical protein